MNTLDTRNKFDTSQSQEKLHPAFYMELDQAPPADQTPSPKLDWLSGGGEIADLIRSKDWSETPLGPIESWPQSLRTTISLCLASNFPINIIWGPEAIQIYNAGYKVLCGSVHPRAIGESYRVTWKSAWSAIGEPFEKARRGETSFLENQRMFLFRNGYLEETFFTFSLSPIRDEAGTVVGLFHPVTETTTAMLNQRRTRLLRDIAAEAANSDNVNEAVQRIVRTLGDYKSDIPGALILLENQMGDLSVAASAGDVDGFTDLSKWPVEQVLESLQPYFVNDVTQRFGKLLCSEYNEPIQRACLLPIKVIGHRRPIGFLAVTFSTRLPFDETYMAFFDLLSGAINLAIANAEANEAAEAERKEFKTDIHDLKTQRISQEQKARVLLESKRAAEAATRSKSTFLANMSHEIRTPLSSILGFTEVLKNIETSLDDRTKYLNIIGRNGQALVRIIDDILDLSKIEAEKLQMEKAPLCLTELIGDVLSMFSGKARGKGLTVGFDPQGLPQFKVDSDAVRIRQILVNLLGNAIKFTTEGGLTIKGEYKEIDHHKYEVTLFITDTGIGITSDQAATLFQAFTQADNSTTRHYGGTGLGLALSQKLAKAMGGDISIEKNDGAHGTTFSIRLVVTKSNAEFEDSKALPSQARAATEKKLNDWKILVVDDAEDNRMLAKIFLEREGAIVHLASSGEEGIRRAQTFNYDVVLMDIQMPELDGYQTLARLRAENYKKPIFALTAHTMKEERDRVLVAGFSGHISKPVNMEALIETLLSHARRFN